MIGKAKSNKSLSATIAYNLKEKAELVYTNKLEGDSLTEYQLQMQDLQRCYQGYGKQLTIHAILSPAITDGQQFTDTQWKTIADSYLQKLNMKELQAIGFLHSDRGHKHLHLVINKVKESNFKPVSDSYIGKKTQKIADSIAIEMKLVRAMQIRQERIWDEARILEAQKIGLPLPEQKPVGSKQQFKASLEQILKSGFHSADDYFKAIENAGFKVHQYRDKQTGDVRGYGIEKDGIKMDASAISKKFTLTQLKITADQRTENEAADLKLNIAPTLTILQDPLRISVLENFAQSMGVSKTVLDKDTEMIQYGKNYFLGLKNDSGGYTLNNVFSKRQVGENDVTTKFVSKELPTIVMEDTLSYLLYKTQHPDNANNYIILNSINNKEKAIRKIAELNLKRINLRLKNDQIGQVITTEITNGLKNILIQNEQLLICKTKMNDGENPAMPINENINNAVLKKRRKLKPYR